MKLINIFIIILVLSLPVCTYAKTVVLLEGDTGIVTHAYKPIELSTSSALSVKDRQRMKLLISRLKNKNLADRIWFTFMEIDFISGENVGCKKIKRSTRLTVSSISLIKRNNDHVFPSVKFKGVDFTCIAMPYQ